jgi:hypothetical protein
LVSSLYDLNEKLLINYRLCEKRNERLGLINQKEYLKTGDTLIMDRGYYSKGLLHFLNEMEVKVIFRMKKDSLMVKKMIEKGQTSMRTRVVYKGQLIPFRIIAYTVANNMNDNENNNRNNNDDDNNNDNEIDNEGYDDDNDDDDNYDDEAIENDDEKDNENDNIYYLGTTIMNHTVSYFKNLYWQRWAIETNFRESKYLLSLKNILSKKPDRVRQDIYSHNILFLIHSFFKKHIQKGLPPNKFINSKNLFIVLMERILYPMLYQNMTENQKAIIQKMCTGLRKNLILKKPNRHYKRIRIKPIGKWYHLP